MILKGLEFILVSGNNITRMIRSSIQFREIEGGDSRHNSVMFSHSRNAILALEVLINSSGEHHMNVDLALLKNLISKRSEEIEKKVAGTGYIAKTAIGVGTFLLDNEGDIDLLSSKQKVIFDKFILPLLATPRR